MNRSVAAWAAIILALAFLTLWPPLPGSIGALLVLLAHTWAYPDEPGGPEAPA